MYWLAHVLARCRVAWSFQFDSLGIPFETGLCFRSTQRGFPRIIPFLRWPSRISKDGARETGDLRVGCKFRDYAGVARFLADFDQHGEGAARSIRSLAFTKHIRSNMEYLSAAARLAQAEYHSRGPSPRLRARIVAHRQDSPLSVSGLELAESSRS